jgi:hypothetical protein
MCGDKWLSAKHRQAIIISAKHTIYKPFRGGTITNYFIVCSEIKNYCIIFTVYQLMN